jgi:hypothetical protein
LPLRDFSVTSVYTEAGKRLAIGKTWATPSLRRQQRETRAQHQPIRTTAEGSLLHADRGSRLNAD